MEHRIFRTKQEEYWDIWCEDAIVFPIDQDLKEQAQIALQQKQGFRAHYNTLKQLE